MIEQPQYFAAFGMPSDLVFNSNSRLTAQYLAACYLGVANERNRALRPFAFHSSYDAPAVI